MAGARVSFATSVTETVVAVPRDAATMELARIVITAPEIEPVVVWVKVEDYWRTRQVLGLLAGD